MTHLYHTPAERLRTQFGLTTFVETGCEDGEGLGLALRYGFAEERLYSCDIRAEAVQKVARMFPKAKLWLSDSLPFIDHIAAHVTEPTLFWLDAHFPALYGTAEGVNWPLFEELKRLKRKRGIERDCIVCDDMRVLNHPLNPRWAVGEVEPRHTIEVDWGAFIHMFDETHTSESILVDTGLMVFTPKGSR